MMSGGRQWFLLRHPNSVTGSIVNFRGALRVQSLEEQVAGQFSEAILMNFNDFANDPNFNMRMSPQL